MPSYRVHGVQLESDHVFRLPLWRAPGPAELGLAYAREELPRGAAADVLYRSPLRTASGESASTLYRLDGGRELLVCPPDGRFLLDGERIFSPRPAARRVHLFEVQFLGALMAYWLERRGVLALHASGIEIGGRAVAFVAGHGGGKTTLAAALVAAGHRLMTDDLLAVESSADRQQARAGYPMLRMDGGLLRRFGVDRRALRRVHPEVAKWFVPLPRVGGEFQPDSLPIAAIFVLERGLGGPAGVSPLRPAEAVRELVRCSFSPYVVEAVGLQPARLGRIADLAQAVPVRRLTCPEGLGRLPEICRALLGELAAIEC